ncbi:hypothetical protein WBJ53_06210 [Spirosoma sp. SC4-14]|uniref:hypothetical protein n=1 Tax=Spirosoma sp. SC4-14 TaxID=3128900 RepID=UPI0030D05883
MQPVKKPYKTVPLKHKAAIAAESMAPPAHRLSYKPGGHVLGAVEVAPVYWGNFWTTNTGLQLVDQLDQFFDFILTSSLMDMLREYSIPTIPIGHGRRIQSVTFTDHEPGVPKDQGREVSDQEIQQQLSQLINNNRLPTVTANTLYFIFLPEQVVSTDGGDKSCEVYCGYHSHIHKHIFYAVVPFPACEGCSFGTVLDTLTKVSSHELAEAVTNPASESWWDFNTGEEIGDICNNTTSHISGFLVQAEWSNQQSACVFTPIHA